MELIRAKVPSPIGKLTVVSDGEGTLRALDFGDFEDRFLKLLFRHYPDARIAKGAVPGPVSDALEAYFAGDLWPLMRVPVASHGSAFQERVWAALRTIPPGATMSYGGLAHEIGSPKASRAVGLANGANPIAIAVPCHRVIGASGSLTGFGGGLPRKRWLLEHEARHTGLFAPHASEPTHAQT